MPEAELAKIARLSNRITDGLPRPHSLRYLGRSAVLAATSSKLQVLAGDGAAAEIPAPTPSCDLQEWAPEQLLLPHPTTGIVSACIAPTMAPHCLHLLHIPL